ncbi:MAG TPA: DNA polymerase III subunit alpha [Nocardioides sp.]|uniref:DNA polymerase III subunit alpha n=1 Tax=Nocardioides sp. TaxID=35761 RepID=UPI002CA01445|nr:DNA polymerase III subunit alpha [Nocardioides sp.]HQR25776.1 DNA polymerase III subunit alpha [Nocardioides sp.]
MRPDPFAHLHVASGYSLQYGASHPHTLVERAAEQEMDLLALTDRDGTYGAVRFAKACLHAGLRPVLGVDLAYRPTGSVPPRTGPPRRSPVRGGTFQEPVEGGLPRVTLLAHAGAGGGRAGWAAICRLVSAVHLAGERGHPVADLSQLAPHLEGGDVVVLLGPASELGAAATRRRDDLAERALAPWREIVPSENLLVELVSHRLPGGTGDWGPGTSPHAARMLGVAGRAGVATVLTNAVRYADRLDAPTVDVLDAARRLVALDRRHVDRGNAEGFLKSGKQMHEMAEEICRLAGRDVGREARQLLARTRAVADRCALDPRADLGLGEVHFPEFAPSTPGADADTVLRARCEGAIGRRYGSAPRQVIWKRLDDELEVIRRLGYASYFLTVGDVTDLIRELGVRCAARGSGAGSLVNYLLGVSGVDPIRHGLLMERFLSPLRQALPDIDVDVESARRTEVYTAILDRYGGERCVAVSMKDTYRVRHAVRDVGAALGMPPGEVDAIAKSFPHIRARDARLALRELPELRASGLDSGRLDLMFRLVERLDGLPRHIALHPCGVLLSDATLLDRTPVEASFAGFPMSQFDKDDVEDLGLLKLDVLGIRMQSAMAHAVAEVERVDALRLDLDDEGQVPFDDPATFAMISSARTLGVFQIESPGQRELVGKSGIESFADIVTDISLFRPGPVKSDMITPYLDAKQGWRPPAYLHDDLRPILGQTHGVVVFHEQVIEMIALFAGVSYAEGDERRRALGDTEGMAETRLWFFPRALGRGYPLSVVEGVWRILEGFASFGFCKAHAAAFALPTYQSAWLKAHWPAHFLAGVLTHDPGMYPKRLILDDARQCGIAVLGLDVNASGKDYLVEAMSSLDTPPPVVLGHSSREVGDGWPDGRAYGIRLALAEVKGITEAEVARILAGRPYHSLTDFWHRARTSRPVLERLVLAGGFDSLYRIGAAELSVRPRGRVTRRDLLLQVAELERHDRATGRAAARRSPPATPAWSQGAARSVWSRAAAQSQATPPPRPVTSVQLVLDLGDEPAEGEVSGLPEMGVQERMKAELEILGLDASGHVVDSYAEFLSVLGVVRSRDLLGQRSRAEVLVAGVKVATQTPPVRSGRRVVFVTLDDATGPVDATFFEDAQGPYAATVFHSWLLVVRGELRRTGRRGISVRATGCWDLAALRARWETEGMAAVRAVMAAEPEGFTPTRRVLVHSSGFTMSPYADVRPAGEPAREVARRLWHRSPGSPG